MKHPRTLAELRADPRIKEVWKEDDGFRQDGRPSYWASLNPGLNCWGCSCLHEGTVAELCDALHGVETGDPY